MAARAQAMAAAERGAEVEITVHATSFDSILALPWDEFQSTLAQGEYSDIQGMCKHLGLNAKGARAELERRLLEHVKDKIETGDSVVADSPEGRGGRVRASRPGVAAAIVRSTAAKEEKGTKPKIQEAMDIDPRLLNAAEAQAFGVAGSGAASSTTNSELFKMPGAAPSASGGPAPWPMAPQMPQFPAQNAFIGTPAPVARASAQSTPVLVRPVAPVQTTPLAEVRARAASVRAALEASAPGPPKVDPQLKDGEKEQAEAAARDYEPSNKDIMTAITSMRQEMVVRDDIKADVMEALQPVNARLDAADDRVTQALEETKNLHERTVILETGAIQEFDRVGKLETEITELRRLVETSTGGVFRKDKHDPALVRISFTNFPAKMTDTEKITEMEGFMKKYFSDVRIMHSDHFNEKASFVQVGTQKIAQRVTDKVKAQKLALAKYRDVKIKPATTGIDLSRNWALGTAEDLIRKHAKAQGKDIEVKKGKDRGVHVGKEPAFVQKQRYDPRGAFQGEFTDLQLP